MKKGKCPHPNCGAMITFDPEDGPPKRCPECGLLLRTSSAKAAATSAATKVAETKTAERKEEKVTAKPANGAVPSANVRSPASSPKKPIEPKPPAEAPEDDDPFGIKQAGRPTNSSVDDLFGSAPPVTSRASQDLDDLTLPVGTSQISHRLKPKRSSWPNLLIALIVVGGVAGGAWWNFSRAKPKPLVTSGDTYTDSLLNYAIAPPNPTWQIDKQVQEAEQVHLAFRRGKDPIWILLKVRDQNDVTSVGQLADAASKEWAKTITDYKAGDIDDVQLAGQKAATLHASGSLAGVDIKREGWLTLNQGLAYAITFTAPVDRFESLKPEFLSTVKSFRYLGDRVNSGVVQIDQTAWFESKKFNYRLKADKKAWRESPDMATSNLFADLKLIEKSKEASVVVAPRKTPNMDALREAYIVRQRKEFSNVTVREADRGLKIGKYDAQQISLQCQDQLGASQWFLTTLIQAGDMIYQIECQALLEKKPAFEPVFQQLVQTFEIVDRPAPKTEASPSENPASAVAKSAPVTPAKDAERKSEPASKSTTAVTKSGANQPASTASATKEDAKGEAKSAPADKPAGKRKSLDDLDADASSKPEKADGSTKSSDAPTPEKSASKADADKKEADSDMTKKDAKAASKKDEKSESKKDEKSEKSEKKRRSLDDLSA